MTSSCEHYDIVLIGSGSGNSLPGPEFADKRIAYIDRGVGPQRVFGGTCLNLGCIPTKMFVHTADVASTPERAGRLNVKMQEAAADFPAIRDRIFARIDPISEAGEHYRAAHEDNENLTLLRGTARFVGEREVEVELTDGGTRRLSGDQFLLAAGSRPVIPPIPGLAEANPLTSDTVMRIEQLPDSIAILGSGVIALEFAHVLHSLGVTVHLLVRSAQILRSLDADISERITEAAVSRYTTHLQTELTRAERLADGTLRLELEKNGQRSELQVAEILVATGRRPNSDLLEAARGGLSVDEAGRVRVDAHQQALNDAGQVIDGIWAIGDLSSPAQLKHVANHELRIARHNMLHPDDQLRSDTMPIPLAVFTQPQIASVGMSEAQARDWSERSGRQIRVTTQMYADIAYGWAMEDQSSFLKLIVDAESTEILGAHIIGPQASTLIQQLIHAMSFGQKARDVARGQYWIHPALPELVENALLGVID